MFSKQLKGFEVLILLALFAGACGAGNNSAQQVAVIVALTQTAAILQSPAIATATPAPAALPLPTSQLTAVSGYQPLGADECNSLQNDLTNTLGLTAVVQNPAPFNDYVKNMSGTGCQITFTSNGNNTMAGASDVFSTNGWTEVNDYGAGGPGGIALGYQKGDALCLYSSESGPGDPSMCPSNMVFAECMSTLTPEQVLRTLTVNCARLVP